MSTDLADNPIWRERLKAALESAGRSRRDVSRAAGLGPNYLHEVLDAGKEPGIERLRAIASELNLSVSYLVGETQQ